MNKKIPQPEAGDQYWQKVYNRIERGLGWIIFSVGVIILVTYGLFKAIEAIFADTQIVGIVKWGILVLIAGIVILLVSVLREKLFVRKSDPFKEVQR